MNNSKLPQQGRNKKWCWKNHKLCMLCKNHNLINREREDKSYKNSKATSTTHSNSMAKAKGGTTKKEKGAKED